MILALDWIAEQRKRDFPNLRRGDIFLSFCHGSFVSKLIARLQGSARDKDRVEWSHVGIYLGNGLIAEATFPKGRIIPFRAYMNPKYTLEVWRVTAFTTRQRASIASEAARLAPNDYDTAKFLRHLIDNGIERLTWREDSQRGFRPLAQLFRIDMDGDRANVCSELVERAVEYGTRRNPNQPGTGIHITGGEIGTARPLDVYQWLGEVPSARRVFRHERGVVTFPKERASKPS